MAPSILSADFSRLGAQVGEVLDAGARVIHVDVMDGHFVPPITFGPIVVERARRPVHDAGGVIDVHLMVERPERHVDDFANAGADDITVHVEATPHVNYALRSIREGGCSAAASSARHAGRRSPRSPAEALDLALCMSVNPGWGGQTLIPASIGKLAADARDAARPRRARGRRRGPRRDRGVGRRGRREPARHRLRCVRCRRPGAAYQEIVRAAGFV